MAPIPTVSARASGHLLRGERTAATTPTPIAASGSTMATTYPARDRPCMLAVAPNSPSTTTGATARAARCAPVSAGRSAATPALTVPARASTASRPAWAGSGRTARSSARWGSMYGLRSGSTSQTRHCRRRAAETSPAARVVRRGSGVVFMRPASAGPVPPRLPRSGDPHSLRSPGPRRAEPGPGPAMARAGTGPRPGGAGWSSVAVDVEVHDEQRRARPAHVLHPHRPERTDAAGPRGQLAGDPLGQAGQLLHRRVGQPAGGTLLLQATAHDRQVVTVLDDLVVPELPARHRRLGGLLVQRAHPRGQRRADGVAGGVPPAVGDQLAQHTGVIQRSY